MKKGWEEVKLGAVCTVIAGQSPKSEFYNNNGKGLPFYQGKKEFTKKYIGAPSKWTRKVTKEAKKEDILMSVRAPVGPVNLATQRICIGRGLAAIRVGERVNKDFLFNFLLKIENEISGNTGAVFNSITKAQVEKIKILLPSMKEQKRIVKKLDEIFEEREKAKANTEKNIENVKELFESYLNSVFTKPLNGWKDKKLGELCKFVRGPFGGSLKKSIFKSSGYAVYEQQHAIYNQFTDVRYFIDENKFNEMKRFELYSGDLIMSCSGTMGKMAIVPVNIKKGIINQALLKLTPLKNILVQFLKLWMQSDSFQNSLKAYSQGAAIQNVASVKILKEIKMPMPSLKEQQSIVSKLDALSDKTKNLSTMYQRKLDDIEELKKSVMENAFDGGV